MSALSSEGELEAENFHVCTSKIGRKPACPQKLHLEGEPTIGHALAESEEECFGPSEHMCGLLQASTVTDNRFLLLQILLQSGVWWSRSWAMVLETAKEGTINTSSTSNPSSISIMCSTSTASSSSNTSIALVLLVVLAQLVLLVTSSSTVARTRKTAHAHIGFRPS